jgi:hypothetical protein
MALRASLKAHGKNVRSAKSSEHEVSHMPHHQSYLEEKAMNAAVRRHLRRKAAALSRDAEKKIAPMLMGVSGNVAKALTLIDGPAAPRQMQEDCGATKEERRNHSIFYKDTKPFGNKIHAVQKTRGKSMPLI